MKKLPCFFAALLLSLAKLISCEDGVITELFKGYDKTIRPNHGTGKPVTIRSSIYVESFGNIEEANMEFKAYIYFRQLWKDLRLTGRVNDAFTIRGGEVDNIWTPDPYCYNARESNMMTPNEEVNVNVQISPNGNITSSRGVTLLASCVMNLRTFPHDSQQCHLKFGSYSYTSSDIVYEWIPGEVQFGNKELSQFQLKGSELTSKIEVFSVGNYSTITVTFSFERRIGYFLIQVYFPDIFVVMLSWIVFWMEKEDIGNRMALGITTILTIMFLLGSLNGNLPKVSYPKALDWYLLVSFSFVFLSLIECMIVYLFVAEAKQDKQKPIKVMENGAPLSEKVFSSLTSLVSFRGKKSGNEGMNQEPGNELEMVNGPSKADKAVVEDGYQDDASTFHKMEKIANAIDKASRFLFPFIFICFNIFYWTYY